MTPIDEVIRMELNKAPKSKQPAKKWADMSRSEKTVGLIVLAFLGLLGIWIISGVINAANNGFSNNQAAKPDNNSNSVPVDTSNTTPSPAPTPTPPTDTHPHFDDGTFTVGTDIQPGTYRLRTAPSGCYWARLAGFSGNTSDILANNNTDAPAIVTILPTDKGFTSTNCGTWTQDLSQITISKTSFSDGTYTIGTDITPGTYKSSGRSGCYWARLSNFLGDTDGILANNNTDTAAIVTIAPTDKGFTSSRCGTWSKM